MLPLYALYALLQSIQFSCSVFTVVVPSTSVISPLNCIEFNILKYTAVQFIALQCVVLHCPAPHCTILHCTDLYCTTLQSTPLHCIAKPAMSYCTELQYHTKQFTALYCTAMSCGLLFKSPLFVTVHLVPLPLSQGIVTAIQWHQANIYIYIYGQ